ncbi:MAG TPA: glycosyltransferase family A protein [Blastocatellia bacterium]|nr:glycosyltransferase family A protein [Blastocatellia bacterium]
MTSKPGVSVITHFLNSKEFFREALDSVIAQNYRGWELLLVDDGSTDGSTDIALSYEREHAGRVRYLHHPGRENRGMSASRNLGVEQARGEYIAFLDADDVWMPEKLDRQIAILDSWPDAAMVYGATLYWYSWTGKDEDLDRDLLIEPKVELDAPIKPPALLIRYLEESAPIPCPSDILVRRDAVKAVGGFEESFRRIFTDQVFYAKLCLKAPVVASNQCWFKYRRHTDSSVSVVKKRGELRAARMTYLNWLEDHLSRQRVGNGDVWRALRGAKRRCQYPRLSRLPNDARYRVSIFKEHLRSAARVMLPATLHQRLRASRGRAK